MPKQYRCLVDRHGQFHRVLSDCQIDFREARIFTYPDVPDLGFIPDDEALTKLRWMCQYYNITIPTLTDAFAEIDKIQKNRQDYIPTLVRDGSTYKIINMDDDIGARILGLYDDERRMIDCMAAHAVKVPDDILEDQFSGHMMYKDLITSNAIYYSDWGYAKSETDMFPKLVDYLKLVGRTSVSLLADRGQPSQKLNYCERYLTVLGINVDLNRDNVSAETVIYLTDKTMRYRTGKPVYWTSPEKTIYIGLKL